ncbi:MAG: hypothetical protein QXR84_09470 [Candidatus Bathyarchaeia archaeon]
MFDILGVGGIVSGIIGGISVFVNILKDIGMKLLDVGKEMLKWMFELLASDPEVGITLMAILMYMISPVTF